MAEVILGISPGTRYTGIALLQEGELIDWHIKSYRGAFTDVKLRALLAAISTLCGRHGVAAIACKVTHHKRSSPQLDSLLRLIALQAHQAGIAFRFYPLDVLKTEGIRNRKALIERLARAYPELGTEFKREQQNRTAYYLRMFEAVACASLESKRK